jgi:hypothetical protein
VPIGSVKIDSGTVGSSVSVTNFPVERSSNIIKSRVVVSDTVVTQLAVSDATRLKLIIHNESGVLFVNFGPLDASSTEYTYRLTAHTTVEDEVWQGRISARKEVGSSAVAISLIKGS